MARLVLALARPYRGWLVIILLAMLLETLAELAGPWPLKIVIDYAVEQRRIPDGLSAILGPGLAADRSTVAGLAAISLIAIAIVSGFASYLDNYYTESVGQWVANDLRLRLFDHLEHLSFNYYDTHQSGLLLSTITDDVSTVQDFVSYYILSILIDLMTILGMLIVMLWLNLTFALLVVIVAPALLVVILRFRQAVKRAAREMRRRQSDVVAVVQAGLDSVRTVQALTAQDLEDQRLAAASRATVSAALSARQIKSLVSPIVATVVAACTGLVLWRGSALVMSGAMTLGTLTIFLTYLARFFKPVQDLAKMTNAVAQANVALERIQAILTVTVAPEERSNARDPQRFAGDIAFDHVGFAYSDDAQVLRGVTFSVRAGQFVGLVGPTGSGKSTIAGLIPRFYDPTDGRVLIDDSDLREYTVNGIRRQIGYVLQDTVLFRGTVRENIAFGRPDATDDQIRNAARLADADAFVMRMPAGYETLIGERGQTLSGGQRQRIGIARALIRDAPILILDEPTASLDPESEQLVVAALKRLMQGRTVIMITHRLDTLHDADAIIVVADGVVAEQGTHESLLTRRGMYAELYRVNAEPQPHRPVTNTRGPSPLEWATN